MELTSTAIHARLAKRVLATTLSLILVLAGVFVPPRVYAAAGDTYNNLMDAVQGETNAAAAYTAFAIKAESEGHPDIANLFRATAAAEAKHADDEWALLVSLGADAADRPVAATPTVGTTAENLQAAIDGETYEFTVMYPGFFNDAELDGNVLARNTFNRTRQVEEVHAQNFSFALANLGDVDELIYAFGTVYRCPTCGAVYTDDSVPNVCPICGVEKPMFRTTISFRFTDTYSNLMDAVQGETNAAAAYTAFAAKAKADGYLYIANLFTATAAAEAKHADDEWAILLSLGADPASRPTAAVPAVGTTAENLQAAIDGETYEFTVMYPVFAQDALDEGYTAARNLFTRTLQAEQMHAGNFTTALNNLADASFMAESFNQVWRCPVCGAVFTGATIPGSRCPICNAGISSFVSYNAILSSDTFAALIDSIQGETNAVAAYLAFAAKAEAEGYSGIANLYRATAAAEQKHADDEWALLLAMGADPATRPLAAAPTVGTTAENLQASIDGETYEYIVMYPGFAAYAQLEGFTAARNMFNRTGAVEEVHAGNFADVLANLDDAGYLADAYGQVWRCPVCGAVFTGDTIPVSNCPICGAAAAGFVPYIAVFSSNTFMDLMASVQGESNAAAAYLAFAAKAEAEGYPDIANLFRATAAAEQKHADDEWALLLAIGADPASRPIAATPVVGTTAENLQAAIDGETYEYSVMYPGFAADANAEGRTSARNMFNRAGAAEEVHAGNFADALANLDDAGYLADTFGQVWRCPVCGAVFTGDSVPASNCPICGAGVASFASYISVLSSDTFSNLMSSVQGESNAAAAYLAFAVKAQAEGYPDIANLFRATAAAEQKHADDEWILLLAMGADPASRPIAATPTVGTTAENLQAAIDSETYEYSVMYPDFGADADAEGYSAARSMFNRAGAAENVHAGIFADALANISDAQYLRDTYEIVYRCPICGAVFPANSIDFTTCPICRASVSSFILHTALRSSTTPKTGESPGVLFAGAGSISMLLVGCYLVLTSRKRQLMAG